MLVAAAHHHTLIEDGDCSGESSVALRHKHDAFLFITLQTNRRSCHKINRSVLFKHAGALTCRQRRRYSSLIKPSVARPRAVACPAEALGGGGEAGGRRHEGEKEKLPASQVHTEG